ncbi:MAG: hypothetical protein QOI10_2030 [Solirubrobacterales bacterium]|jgi:hypothetical protein|nr:hypothetical protein [Solirubrobacterales bacterium]
MKQRMTRITALIASVFALALAGGSVAQASHGADDPAGHHHGGHHHHHHHHGEGPNHA